MLEQMHFVACSHDCGDECNVKISKAKRAVPYTSANKAVLVVMGGLQLLVTD